jgi:alkylhydroperoxidase family enzyme
MRGATRGASNYGHIMASAPDAPRLSPLTKDEVTEEQRELLESVATTDGWAINIFATLVRHPGLFRRWLPFGGKLLAGKLPARDRELLILRTGWLCQSEYEWGQHVLIARGTGITDDEIDRVKRGADTSGWTSFDATLLRAAEELHESGCIGDGTWDALAARYDERQLVEVPMLVGHYHMVAFTLNSLGVQREPGVPGLADS